MASTYTRRSITSAETFNKLTVSCWFKGMADGTQRNFWGCELDENYYKKSIERYDQLIN